MKIIFFLFSLLVSLGLFAQTDKELLLDYLKESNDLNSYDLVEKEDVFYLKGMNKDKEEEFLFISSEQDEVRGYSGSNKVIIILARDKSIQKAILVKSYDTKSFVRRVQRSNFLRQFIAWNGKDTIKAVTGATITSNSVKTTISNLLKRIETIDIFIN